MTPKTTKNYQYLLDQATKLKLEMNILYDLYKDKRQQYDSIRNQIETIILERKNSVQKRKKFKNGTDLY